MAKKKKIKFGSYSFSKQALIGWATLALAATVLLFLSQQTRLLRTSTPPSGDTAGPVHCTTDADCTSFTNDGTCTVGECDGSGACVASLQCDPFADPQEFCNGRGQCITEPLGWFKETDEETAPGDPLGYAPGDPSCRVQYFVHNPEHTEYYPACSSEQVFSKVGGESCFGSGKLVELVLPYCTEADTGFDLINPSHSPPVTVDCTTWCQTQPGFENGYVTGRCEIAANACGEGRDSAYCRCIGPGQTPIPSPSPSPNPIASNTPSFSR